MTTYYKKALTKLLAPCIHIRKERKKERKKERIPTISITQRQEDYHGGQYRGDASATLVPSLERRQV